MQPPHRIESDVALDRVLKNNVLTAASLPFHAVLTVAAEEENPTLHARVELFWQDAQTYRLTLDSPNFGQTLVVNRGRISEIDRGDFYPDWLQNFATALLDPIPRIGELWGLNQPIGYGEGRGDCVRQEVKVNGIGDELAWEFACFNGDEPHLSMVRNFTYEMGFEDLKPFHSQQIARIYRYGIMGNPRLRGTLSTLEDWTPDQTMLAVSTPTPAKDRILTSLVSTPTEESMVEVAPKDFVWPGVRAGKLEGYMIIYARTDRTGQVRESAEDNSDNNGVLAFGAKLALKYKFKPLTVDGVPQQMEMPLVLHFNTRLENPIPELDDATSRKAISGCDVPRKVQDPASRGQEIVIKIEVSADGHVTTLGSSDRKIPVLSLFQQFRGCQFAVISQKGVPTAYHANLTVTAK